MEPDLDLHAAHGGEVVWRAAPSQVEAEIWGGSAREEMFLDQHRPVAGRPPEIRPPRSETVVYESGIAEGQYAPRASMLPDIDRPPLDRSLYNDNAMGVMRHLIAADPVVLDSEVVFGDEHLCMDGASHDVDALALHLLHASHGDVASQLEEDSQPSGLGGDMDEMESLPSPSVMRAAADMTNGLGKETSSMFRCSSPLSPIHEFGEPGAPSPSQAIEARNRLEQRLQEKVAGREELSAADYGGGYPREGNTFLQQQQGNIANMSTDPFDPVKNPLPASSRARYWQIREKFLAQ